MTLQICLHEKGLRELLKGGRWPAGADPDLRAHVSACSSCNDLVIVETAFTQARARSAASVQLPPPGILLWRAQLRRRNAAIEKISRPLLSAQIFALAVALLSGSGFVVFEARHGLAWLAWFQNLPKSPAGWSSLLNFASEGSGGLFAGFVLAAFTVLGGVAVYLATDR